MQRKIVVILIVLISWIAAKSKSVVDFDTNCKSAFVAMMEFEFSKSGQILQIEKKQKPENLIPSYISVYQMFIQAVVEENAVAIQNFQIQSDKILVLFEALQANSSPWINYCISDLYIQKTFIHFKNQNYLSGVNCLRKAMSSLEKNQKLYPSFLPNKKIGSIIQIGFGSVPTQYNWILSMFDINASVNQGFRDLETLTNASIKNPNYFFLRNESLLISGFTSYNFSFDKVKTKQILEILETDSLQNQINESPFLIFTKMSLYQNLKQNEKALSCFFSYKNKSKELSFHYLNFMAGESLLNKLDITSRYYFEQYLNHFAGNSYKKSARQKLAWLELIKGNVSAYKFEIRKIGSLPATMVDADKQAVKEYKQNTIPEVNLLKSRLLFDGGYYREALKILQQKQLAEKFSPKELLELFYRQGRIYHETIQFDNALLYYKKTIDKGRNQKFYFAANAALQSAFIYEELKNSIKAREMYELCLSLDYDEYQNSISQKAKAGLNRLEKK